MNEFFNHCLPFIVSLMTFIWRNRSRMTNCSVLESFVFIPGAMATSGIWLLLHLISFFRTSSKSMTKTAYKRSIKVYVSLKENDHYEETFLSTSSPIICPSVLWRSLLIFSPTKSAIVLLVAAVVLFLTSYEKNGQYNTQYDVRIKSPPAKLTLSIT